MTDTSEVARALHDAGGDERFTMEITAEKGDRAFRWRGCGRSVRCAIELLAARLLFAELNGDDDGGGDHDA